MIGSIDGMRSIHDLDREIGRVRGLLENGERLGGAIEWRGRIVGSAKISHITQREEGDLGYWLFKEARGQGLVTRCGRALIDAAFHHLDLKAVTIFAAVKNHSSCAVAERLGMTLEEIRPQSLLRGGRKYDGAHYRVTRDDWSHPYDQKEEGRFSA